MNWGMIATLVTALAAVIGVVISIYKINSESKRFRFALGIDTILKMDERFNSEEMKKIRQVAAKSLRDQTNTDVEDVLDFFETIGMLTHKGALDEEMVWNTFYYWVIRYWYAAKEYIETKRKEDPSIYSELIYLKERLIDIEKKKHLNAKIEFTKNEIEEFLTEETEIK